METGRAAAEASRAFDYDRTVALSDGVFAIALTLLVLTISFPDLHGAARGRLVHELGNRLPQLFSYLVSFAVLAFLWLRHHAFFRGLTRIDTSIVTLNLVYLALIAFLPYPTRLLGEYGDQPSAVVMYATTIVLIAVVASLVRIHAARVGLLPAAPTDTRLRHIGVPAVFLGSIPLALFVSPSAAEWSWTLLLIMGPLRRLTQRPSSSTG